MRAIHLDCPSGIAGDMLLAALIDLGAPIEDVRSGLAQLSLSEPWEIDTKRVLKRGISALQLEVRIGGANPDERVVGSPMEGVRQGHAHGHNDDHGREDDHDLDHAHAHDHHRHDHRPYGVIRELIGEASLPTRAKERALRVFAQLAWAEGLVHGIPPDDVHFHEVGSTDAIIDIVGVCLALESLGVEALTASPLHTGWGFVRAAHGRIPVPAPATLKLLEGIDVYQTDVRGELVTPTGAALVRALCDSVGSMPKVRIERVGCGAGRMELPIPNVLRAVLCERTDSTRPDDLASDSVVEMQANLDDLSPELFPVAFERLLSAGAKDVWVTPATMKKGRPAYVLHVLADPSDEIDLARIVFRETTTLGLRILPVKRWTLGREWFTVETKDGPVRVKVARMGDAIVNLAPEFEDCRSVATAAGIPLKAVMDMAREAARKGLGISDG